MPSRIRTSILLAAVLLIAAPAVPAVRAQVAPGPNVGVEAAVRGAFAEHPVMIEVARCESGFRQFAADGSALRGGAGRGYIGVFQIGERLHAAPARALGHDIFTLEGNIAYALHLFAASGTTPWRECVPSVLSVPVAVAGEVAPVAVPVVEATPAVSTASIVAATPAPTAPFRTDLRIGMRHADVLRLQRVLNVAGSVVATSGPGSSGNETDFFGELTRDAVRRFQCAQGIVCSGTESTTGYGRVGPRTRAALDALAP